MADLPSGVARLLRGLETGDWSDIESCFLADTIFDASVPNWRFQFQGPAALAEELRGWTASHVWNIAEQIVTPTPDGVILELETRGRCPGDDAHAEHDEMSRTALLFRIAADGRIADMKMYCAGEWDEETMQRIEAEAPKVRPRAPSR
ncbi:MAG TPA: nuclear transport factor 2 family protein [Mycobacteriales bacterium]|nr:nuclear transport factor 2 family protein [Mycobacteriales bacterium]